MTAKQTLIPARTRPSQIEKFVEGERKVGRPKRVTTGEKLFKTSFVLPVQDVIALDEMVLSIRKGADKIVSRSDIAHAILTSVLEDPKARERIEKTLVSADPEI